MWFTCLVCKVHRVSRLGSVTARHSSSGRQPSFAALNRGRHLYSAGRPSCWALAHISSCCSSKCYWMWFTCLVLRHVLLLCRLCWLQSCVTCPLMTPAHSIPACIIMTSIPACIVRCLRSWKLNTAGLHQHLSAGLPPSTQTSRFVSYCCIGQGNSFACLHVIMMSDMLSVWHFDVAGWVTGRAPGL